MMRMPTPIVPETKQQFWRRIEDVALDAERAWYFDRSDSRSSSMTIVQAVYAQALRDMLALWMGMPGDTWRDDEIVALMRDWAAERGIDLEQQT